MGNCIEPCIYDEEQLREIREVRELDKTNRTITEIEQNYKRTEAEYRYIGAVMGTPIFTTK